MSIIFLILNFTFRNDLGLGGHHSNLRYPVADTITRDTVVPSTELRTFWNLYLDHNRTSYRLKTENSLRFSTSAITDWFNFHLTIPVNSLLTFGGGAEAEVCHYHNCPSWFRDSVTGESYINSVLRLDLDYRPSDRFIVNGGDQIEYQHYLSPDSIFDNYYLNRVKIAFTCQLPDYQLLELRSGINRLWSRTRTQQNYVEYILNLNWNGYPAQNWSLQLANNFSRRAYATQNRSYLDLNPSLLISHNISSCSELRLEENIGFLWFDIPSSIYSNQFTDQLEMELELQPLSQLALRIGPQIANLRSLRELTAQDYQEIAIALGIDISRTNQLWLSLEDRLGMRRYLLADSAFQSGYRFNEFTCTGHWRILRFHQRELVLTMMLNITPEWHTEKIDNLAALSSSVELKYCW